MGGSDDAIVGGGGVCREDTGRGGIGNVLIDGAGTDDGFLIIVLVLGGLRLAEMETGGGGIGSEDIGRIDIEGGAFPFVDKEIVGGCGDGVSGTEVVLIEVVDVDSDVVIADRAACAFGCKDGASCVSELGARWVSGILCW